MNLKSERLVEIYTTNYDSIRTWYSQGKNPPPATKPNKHILTKENPKPPFTHKKPTQKHTKLKQNCNNIKFIAFVLFGHPKNVNRSNVVTLK